MPLPEEPYEDASINAWSNVVRTFDGFVFVTPQYNRGYPASLKIAIDHLFYEWGGKAALIVSYGGRGGGLCNDALRGVLVGCHIKPAEARVELDLKEGVRDSEKGILAETVTQRWEKDGKGEAIVKGFKELLGLLQVREE